MKIFSPKIKKPLLRGHFHQAAFFIAVGACAMLIAKSHSTIEYISTIIYALSITGLYGISALYHRPKWGREAYLVLRRLDHSAIFVMIAGTATPVCLLGLKGHHGIMLATLFWIIAFIGILQAVLWTDGPKWVRAVFYVGAGWLASPYMPEINAVMGTTNMLLLLGGGVIYTIGAGIYALKRPNPFPEIFGYHEIFHILVVIASAFHFIAISRMVSGI